tara:strand:- start:332 stop:622 length:291 start_codon:yes stop_codon:yes gene_type:complete
VSEERVKISHNRTKIAMFVSLILVVLSINSIINDGSLSGEVWALILLIPLTIGIGLSLDRSKGETEIIFGLENEQIDEEVDNDSEPLEEGFDIPIL